VIVTPAVDRFALLVAAVLAGAIVYLGFDGAPALIVLGPEGGQGRRREGRAAAARRRPLSTPTARHAHHRVCG
jgi:hypothetical protein